ncbi:lipid droplet-associated protein [Gordonia sputi]|uniref:lipid droplet-associated protein n=1 Tax=Gordonia sputi TaxID=36823 RepID=UPI00058693E0|nr:lipid droplet-associated protein [Gordonia sputi]NKY93213.1 lipid droplet-associated protein [Gordonia sputi]
MVRAPYPARIAAGLIVVAIEETRRLPTRLFTLPMTAVSQTLQAGMRAQQQIAELAIKGDEALDLLFDKPDEQPEWARFDEDELTEIDPGTPIESPDTEPTVTRTAEVTTLHATPKTPAKSKTAAKSSSKPAASHKTSTHEGASTKTATEKNTHKSTATKDSAPAKATTKAADAATTTKPAEPAKTATPESNSAAKTAAPRADAGRFALYSSAPADLIAGETPTSDDDAADVDKPEIVEFIEYDTLTLAQLRAKLRTVDLDDLTALVAYETATKNRAPFITMLDNRITAQNKRS